MEDASTNNHEKDESEAQHLLNITVKDSRRSRVVITRLLLDNRCIQTGRNKVSPNGIKLLPVGPVKLFLSIFSAGMAKEGF